MSYIDLIPELAFKLFCFSYVLNSLPIFFGAKPSPETFGFFGKVLGGLFGGGGGGKAPAAPDPYETARAQSIADQNSARANALLMNPSINSPYGNISYDVNSDVIAGQNVRRPTQTISLSPGQQQIFNQRQKIGSKVNRAGSKMANYLPQTPINTSQLPQRPMNIDMSRVDAVPTMSDFEKSRQEIANRIYRQGWDRINREHDRQYNQMDSILRARGLGVGMPAHRRLQEDYRRGKAEAMQNLEDMAYLSSLNYANNMHDRQRMTRADQMAEAERPYHINNMIRQDSIGEDMNLRNQQINELSAIMQGSPAITNPSGAPYNQAAMRSPDIASMINQNYGHRLNAFNQNQDRNDAFMTGLFSLGGGVLGGMFGGPMGASMGSRMGGQFGRSMR